MGRRLNHGPTMAVWPWLLLAAALVGVTILVHVLAPGAGAAGMGLSVGLAVVGMALRSEPDEIERQDSPFPWLDGRSKRVVEALRNYHQGADRGELLALLTEAWGPPKSMPPPEPTVHWNGEESGPGTPLNAALDEALDHVNGAGWELEHGTPIGVSERLTRALEALKRAGAGADRGDFGQGRSPILAEVHRHVDGADPVFAKEVAAHPTMMGLAGGGVPSDREALLEKATRTEHSPKWNGEKGGPR